MIFEDKLKNILDEDGKYINSRLERDLSNKSIFIYGSGNMGFLTCEKVCKIANVEAILDRMGNNASKYKRINEAYNIPIYKPDDKNISAEKRKSSIVLIAIILKSNEYKEIKKSLLKLGYSNVYYSRPYFYKNILPIEYEYIYNVFNLLGDYKSREIYTRIIEPMGGVSEVNFDGVQDCIEDQYFPKDIEFNNGYDRFIDCGAFKGDTLKNLFNNKGKVEAIVSFEPDINNYNDIIKFISNNKVANEHILFPCAIGEKNETLKFNNEFGEGNYISKDGNISVPVVSLDSCIPDFAPTFIKMDIEGAELNGIKGARNTIEKYKPDLAICIYHNLEHLWKIILYIRSIENEYTFYIRTYEFAGMETVLYAILKN